MAQERERRERGRDARFFSLDGAVRTSECEG
jgi:hypothetical protein